MIATYVQEQGLVTKLVDDEAFIISAVTIENLSPVAAILWLLLEQPLTERQLCDEIAAIYADVPRARLRRDVRQLLKTLATRKFLRTISVPAARKASRPRSTKR